MAAPQRASLGADTSCWLEPIVLPDLSLKPLAARHGNIDRVSPDLGNLTSAIRQSPAGIENPLGFGNSDGGR
jgi:hypothetical protein